MGPEIGGAASRFVRIAAAVTFLAGAMSMQVAMADEAGAATIGGFLVKVSSEDGACVIEVARGETTSTFTVPLPSPCALHTKADGTPRTMARGDDLFFLVESSKPAADGSKDCDTRIQAVRLDRYGADLAPTIERVAACLPMDWDDAVFLSMF